MTKYLRISSHIRKPCLLYDFATVPIWISLYMRKNFFFFNSVFTLSGRHAFPECKSQKPMKNQEAITVWVYIWTTRLKRPHPSRKTYVNCLILWWGLTGSCWGTRWSVSRPAWSQTPSPTHCAWSRPPGRHTDRPSGVQLHKVYAVQAHWAFSLCPIWSL